MLTSPWHVLVAVFAFAAFMLFMRKRRQNSALPLADTTRYASGVSARWTAIVSGALALVIVLVMSLALLVSTRDDQTRERFSIPDTNGIIVLDVSGSMEASRKEIADTLERIATDYGKGRKFGFIVFSDTAYALYAPDVSADELWQISTRFRRSKIEQFGQEAYIPSRNPLMLISSGTYIVSGLELARELLIRAGINGGTVILISDLQDSSASTGLIGPVLKDYVKEERNLRVIGLGAYESDKALYRQFVGNEAFVLNADEFATLHGAPKSASETPVGSLLLFVLLVAAFAALAINERRTTELEWQSEKEQRR